MTKKIQVLGNNSYYWDKSIQPTPETPQSKIEITKLNLSKILIPPKSTVSDRDSKYRQLLGIASWDREKKNKEENSKLHSQSNQLEPLPHIFRNLKKVTEEAHYNAVKKIGIELKNLAKSDVSLRNSYSMLTSAEKSPQIVITKSMLIKSCSSSSIQSAVMDEIPNEKITGRRTIQISNYDANISPKRKKQTNVGSKEQVRDESRITTIPDLIGHLSPSINEYKRCPKKFSSSDQIYEEQVM